MEITRTKTFAKSAAKIGMTEAEIRALEAAIVANPAVGDVIQGLRGVRKVRFALGNKGKRGGGRGIYLVLWEDDHAFLLLAYSKADQADLSEAQRKAILKIVEDL